MRAMLAPTFFVTSSSKSLKWLNKKVCNFGWIVLGCIFQNKNQREQSRFHFSVFSSPIKWSTSREFCKQYRYWSWSVNFSRFEFFAKSLCQHAAENLRDPSKFRWIIADFSWDFTDILGLQRLDNSQTSSSIRNSEEILHNSADLSWKISEKFIGKVHQNSLIRHFGWVRR